MLIYSGRPSNGANALAAELGIKKTKENGRTLPANRVLINWGNTQLPTRFRNCNVINKPEDIETVSNKLNFFYTMEGETLITPWWTDEIQDAKDKMINEKCKIVCRKVLNGHSGVGIVIANTPEELVPAPLYVEYIPKKDEYRVHIFRGNIIDIRRKARRRDVANPNWMVRNLAGGFIYTRTNLGIPVPVTDVATKCMERLGGLDFGAVDVIYNEKNNKAYVLEVNSAPGLEGTTIKNYAEAFRSLL